MIVIKVAFIFNFKKNSWLGGYNLIRDLIVGLKKYHFKEIKPVIIVDNHFKKNDLKDFKNIEIIKNDLFTNKNFLIRNFFKFILLFFDKNFLYEKFLIHNKINFVSHINIYSRSFIIGKKSYSKSISLIPDFQHFYYKENFSLRQIFFRNLNIYLAIFFSNCLLLISKNAQNDLISFSKLANKKSFVITPSFSPPELKNILSYQKIKKKYGIKNNFFYLPNHYWKHKNHLLVLKSLNYLKTQNKLNNTLIISTGSKNESVDSELFKNLQSYIKENNLINNYKYLGIVPYRDVLSLIFYSIAVINPSRFEGRSSTVEQSDSLGKKILLSNLKIHKEQNPSRAYYFNPNDYINLSKKIHYLNKNFKKKHEVLISEKKLKISKQRFKTYIKDYTNFLKKFNFN